MAHHGRNTAGKENHKSQEKIHESHPFIPEIARSEASRPVTAGTGKHRGDRRDTSPTYTNNEKHAARGNTPRKDVTTRAR